STLIKEAEDAEINSAIREPPPVPVSQLSLIEVPSMISNESEQNTIFGFEGDPGGPMDIDEDTNTSQ
ncbi:hypothetical protein CCACVL1_23228, partial [Corchorus capsularis]